MKKLKYYEKAAICRETLCLSQPQLAKMLGTEQPMYSRFETGKVRTPGYIDRLLPIFKTNRSWLYDDIGEPPSYWPHKKEQPTFPIGPHNFQLLSEILKISPKAYVLGIKEIAMSQPNNPKQSLEPGDFIAIDPDREPKNLDYVLAVLKENNEIIIRQFINESGHQFLSAHHRSFKPIQIEEVEKICGVVIQKIQNFSNNEEFQAPAEIQHI